jgi:hypothetical protein
MLYSFAFILDPRAKLNGFNSYLQVLSKLLNHDYYTYYNNVRNELVNLFAKYDSKFGALRLQRPSQPTAAPGDDPAVWGLIFRGAPGSFAAPNPASSRPTISAAISELSAYLDSDSLNQYDASFHVLNWWHDHK